MARGLQSYKHGGQQQQHKSKMLEHCGGLNNKMICLFEWSERREHEQRNPLLKRENEERIAKP